MKNALLIFCMILISLSLTTNCSLDRKSSSDAVIEKVHLLIKAEEFDRLYEELDPQAKSLTPKQEFLDDIKEIVGKMKKIDPDVSWNKSNVLLSNGDIAKDLYFVNREMGEEAQKIELRFTVSFNSFTPQFYDLCVAPAESNSETCVTDALRKI